jgi:transcriptional regulator with XRE-family HTH domain
MVKSGRRLRILDRTGRQSASRFQHLFVLCSATALAGVAPLARAANRRHQLRALFVRRDIEPGFIGPLLDEAAVRFSRNVVLHEGPELPDRVLRAWEMGAQDRLIAEADVTRGKLMVLTCALERLEIPLAEVPPLARLPKVQRSEFELAGDGSYLHWPEADVHLDLDALRAVVDPAWRARLARERATHDSRFGRAVSALRREDGLKQADIPGVSARQVRRIECGALPRVETLRRLARAHGLELGAYLARIAAIAEGLPRPSDGPATAQRSNRRITRPPGAEPKRKLRARGKRKR